MAATVVDFHRHEVSKVAMAAMRTLTRARHRSLHRDL